MVSGPFLTYSIPRCDTCQCRHSGTSSSLGLLRMMVFWQCGMLAGYGAACLTLVSGNYKNWRAVTVPNGRYLRQPLQVLDIYRACGDHGQTPDGKIGRVAALWKIV